MKRKIIAIVSVVAVLVISVLGVYAVAQETATTQKGKATKAQGKTPTSTMGCCPGGMMCGTMGASTTGGPQAMMQRCMNMMRKAGMTPAMMQRCQVMMRTPIFIDSPCAIYGQAEALKLSEEQKEKLIEIENEARKKAMDVLTDEQKKKMGDIPNKPMAMAQMCQQMCGKMMPMMQKMMGGKGKAGPMMMCPMMQMMGGKGQEGSMTCSQMQKPPKGNDVQAKNSEQVTCPVMGSPINKNFFTEYKDKKVYFCCGGPCKGKFEANPEKYIAKLPQFKELKNGNSK